MSDMSVVGDGNGSLREEVKSEAEECDSLSRGHGMVWRANVPFDLLV